MSKDEKTIREQIYQEIMDFEKDFYKKRKTPPTIYGSKEINYMCHGLKMAAKLVKAGNPIGI